MQNHTLENEEVINDFSRYMEREEVLVQIFPGIEQILTRVSQKLDDLKTFKVPFCEYVFGDKFLGRRAFVNIVSKTIKEKGFVLSVVEISQGMTMNEDVLTKLIIEKIEFPFEEPEMNEKWLKNLDVIRARPSKMSDLQEIAELSKTLCSGTIVIIDDLENILQPYEGKFTAARNLDIERSFEAISRLVSNVIGKLDSVGIFLVSTKGLWVNGPISLAGKENALRDPVNLSIDESRLLKFGRIFLTKYDEMNNTKFSKLDDNKTISLFKKGYSEIFSVDLKVVCNELDTWKAFPLLKPPTEKDIELVKRVVKSIVSEDKSTFTEKKTLIKDFSSTKFDIKQVLIGLLQEKLRIIEKQFDEELRKEMTRSKIVIEGKYPAYKALIDNYQKELVLDIKTPYQYVSLNGIYLKISSVEALVEKIKSQLEMMKNSKPTRYTDDNLMKIFLGVLTLVKATNVKVLEINTFLDLVNQTLLQLGIYLTNNGDKPEDILKEKLSKHEIWSSLAKQGIRFETGRADEYRGIRLEKLEKIVTIMVLYGEE